ncbi:MAG: prephenate dehydrogenase [Phycisphaerae bacterium]
MHKIIGIKNLDQITIVGVGLLGGSIGLALRAAGFGGLRIGAGRRACSLRKALDCDAVDVVTRDVTEAVCGSQLVILCTPIGQLDGLISRMAPALSPGTYVTDVASTKAEVVRMAERLLPDQVRFVGSHPMAGSEKTGVEFARADLFQLSTCILTPTPRTKIATVRWMRRFWEALGCRTVVTSPDRHDELLARVSHLPHAVAAALVSLAVSESAIDLAGPGFADATRIASGDATMWTDIFRTNRRAILRAVDRLVAELRWFRQKLDHDDAQAILRWLAASREARNKWISRRYKKKVLPP